MLDGATAYGVMALMGLARYRTGARFPLLGLAAVGTVDVSCPDLDAPKGGAALDRNHTHFILVPGSRWGDESPWISACAGALAGTRPSLTLVAAGGEVTRIDVAQGLDAPRPLLVISGSGGTADELARWCRGGDAPTGIMLGETELGLTLALDLTDPSAVLARVSRALGP